MMIFGQRAAGTLLLIAVGVSGLVTFPGGGKAIRDDGLETIVLGPLPGSEHIVAAETTDEEAQATASPAFLIIPSIDVMAVIEKAGLTPDRQMENPTTWDNVAWYRYGPVPGQKGSAVLAGHLDSETDKAVFWDLKKLKPGDAVEVMDTHGELHTFIVTGSELYKARDVPMEEIFAQSGKPRIALITCDGAWNSAVGYDERFIVYAELAG